MCDADPRWQDNLPTPTPSTTDFTLWGEAYAQRYDSQDRSTQVGVIIAGPDDSFSGGLVYGANRFPKLVHDLDARHERPAKYQFIEHAERNAIYTAAREGTPLDGATIYIASAAPGFPPCCDCARAIIGCGIKRIVGKLGDNDPKLWRPDWKDSMAAAAAMLQEAGVAFDTIDVSGILT